MLLRIGDIWQQQTLAMEPDYQLESFDHVAIKKETTSLIKAGAKPDDEGFLLQLSEHPGHRRATHSYCLMVDLPDDRRLVIPCVELIRFYFGSSSSLMSNLFMPPLQRESLYKEFVWDASERHLKLLLADKMSGASASDIGRVHGDPVAWRAAAHVGASLLKATANGQAAFPQAFFPFEGVTNLTCAGKWLSRGETRRMTFLAYQLRSCSYPFPFKSLRYRLSGARRGSSKGGVASGSASTQVRSAAQNSSDQQLVEREATNKLTAVAKQVSGPVRFPDLMRKYVRKVATENAVHDVAVNVAGAHEVKEVALGESTGHDRVRPIELSVIMDPSNPLHQTPPNFLCEMCTAMSAIAELKFDLLTRSPEDGWTVSTPIVADADGVIEPRLFICDAPEAPPRLRRMAAFTASQGEESLTIVAIEDSKCWWKLYGPLLDHDESERLFEIAATDFVTGKQSEQTRIVDVLAWVFSQN